MAILIEKGEGTAYFPGTNSYRRRPIDPKSEVLQLLLIGFGVSTTTLNKNYSAEVKGGEAIGRIQAVVLELTSISETTSVPEGYPVVGPADGTPVQARLIEKSRLHRFHLFESEAQ
jgi:hypothetical protein